MIDYSIDYKLFNPRERKDGVSAFMRVRNGAEFLKIVIESHIDFFDEFIVCYNQCTDDTESILNNLKLKYPNKLNVYFYKPRVVPIGSKEHENTPSTSVNSFVYYSNFALSKTSCKIVTKIDDDHLAIVKNFKKAIKKAKKLKNSVLSYSGINLFRSSYGELGVVKSRPFSGNGDIMFFPISQNTYFTHTPTQESFNIGNLRYEYAGIIYFHLKYLKSGYGFDNYELDKNSDSRYKKMFESFNNGDEIFQYYEDFIKKGYKDDPRLIQDSKRIKLARYLPYTLLKNIPHIKNDQILLRFSRFRSDMKGIKIPVDIIENGSVC